MPRRRSALVLSLLGLLLLPAARPPARAAAQAPEDVIFTDPQEAGPDFQIQGEYAGTAGDEKMGAQVVALGEGKFQAVFFHGGLPGDGWDGKERVRADGGTTGELIFFESQETGWNGRIGRERFIGETGGGTRFVLRKVTRRSPTLGEKPPAGGVVLFDGTATDAWEGGRVTEDGLLNVGARTKAAFRDFTLHLEFRTPFRPAARGQRRGNSGVYLLGQYEIQILDSFGLEGLDRECGALYRVRAPRVNMCFPPLSWQTFDIDFQAARFNEAGQKVQNAVITVRHNGVAIHEKVELPGPTGGAQRRPETGGPGPISIQNHRNPIHLRNVWIVEPKP